MPCYWWLPWRHANLAKDNEPAKRWQNPLQFFGDHGDAHKGIQTLLATPLIVIGP